jgi:RNA polymerase sigma factor (sigma-70 family)
MAKQSLTGVLQHLRKVAAVHTSRELSDRDLLERFVGKRDEAAFIVLFERHGPMVLGVCRRALPAFHDAEDACQAVFLVLARKAASVRKRTSLSSWLHGVACRVAANLKREQARRRAREQRVDAPASRDPAAEISWQEARTILDEELHRLPESCRAPIVLCYLECLTRDEAARRLGLSLTTLHGRLERARDLLRERLTKRGLTLSTAITAAALGETAAQGALAPTFVISATKIAMLFAAREPVTESLIATNVLALTQEVLTTMFTTKLKLGAAAVLCVGLFAAMIGGSFISLVTAQDAKLKSGSSDGIVIQDPLPGPAKQTKTEQRSGYLEFIDVDLAEGTVKGQLFETTEDRSILSFRGELWELLVKPTTKIILDGKDATLADLKKIKPADRNRGRSFVEVKAELEVGADPKQGQAEGLLKSKGSASRIDVTGPRERSLFQAANADKIMVRSFYGDVIDKNELELNTAKDAPVTIDDQAATLGDLKPNMKVALQISAVNNLVVGIRAYGATVGGMLKAVDPAKNAVSVTIPSIQMTVEGVSVAKNAKVEIDGKDAKLSDLKTGMRVTLQMSAEPDQSVIIAITK